MDGRSDEWQKGVLPSAIIYPSAITEISSKNLAFIDLLPPLFSFLLLPGSGDKPS
jgi:hypothetical protein